RLPAVLRRALTRALAIVPAIVVLAVVGDQGLTSLLVGSQIVLSLQLPFAMVPLIKLTSSRSIMGEHRNSTALRLIAAGCTLLIVAANGALIVRCVTEWWEPWPWLAGALAAAGTASFVFLLHVASVPLRSARS
ncbi:MAG TPA: divalent metal cation transporter, partial [Polyangiales bacterium]|nr:divalent metal cation transporter [Polyangiales bacterium]